MNLTFTLQQIRDQEPCRDGWKTLLASLGYAGGNYPPDRRVSLGDVAKSNNAADALWCVHCLDWSGVAVRRAVISSAVLPAVKRAAKHTQDARVAESIAIIERWCSGDDAADLKFARKIAYAAYAAYAASASAASAAAASAAASTSTSADAACAAYAAYAAAAASTAAADARKAEREQQRRDIIAAFPPIA
jgi:hypothetical protein